MNNKVDLSTEIVPSYYIGIGASAGGLEALADFFGNLPPETDAAYIVVQHLSPDFKSMMPELLAKHTNMPIFPVEDGVLVRPNSIYLMPPRKNMLLAEGKLLISDQMPANHPHMPIDIFFRALAEDQQHKAIGVILSGTGSDGTRGIKAIKESGGLIIVQEPNSAKFDGMPISAYKTGLADLSLPPSEMGDSILRFIRHPSISGDHSEAKLSKSFKDETLDEIFKLLKQQSSINFSHYKASTVARRIERRLGVNQLESLEAYRLLLLESPRELQILSRELLIGVTRFFRDEEAFSILNTQVIPDIIENSLDTREGIRIWVAGCSSGEEAYSLAILFDEHLRSKGLDISVKIFATDVDEEAIANASSGVYSADIIQDVSLERLERYFDRKETTYCVKPKVRQMVIFAVHNMIDDPPFSNINMVCCRNVLIYFQHATQKKVLSSLYFALKTSGYLFLGTSESLGDLQTHFESVNERARIFVKISNARIPLGNHPPSLSYTSSNSESRVMSPVTRVIRAMKGNNGTRSGIVNVLERLVEEYVPDCIVLNESFDAIHVYGDVSKYTKGIRHGKVSNNIKDIIIDDLSVAVSTALYRAEKNNSDVFYKDVTVGDLSQNPAYIDLSVLVVSDSDQANAARHYLLQFVSQKEEIQKDTSNKKISFDASEQSRQRIIDLENELIKKQEHLQVTIEELETTNEELQSANEELMSANEELQSTNEELQSVNEELYTVNSEYQQKIIELTEANEDLDSVVNATKIGIIFLDDQLAIRRYTSYATNYINVRESDIGRPFHHISHDLSYEDFFSDILKVSSSRVEIEKTCSTYIGHEILVRLIPFQSIDEESEAGVLITLTDITKQKNIEKSLKNTHDKMLSYFTTSGRPNKLLEYIGNISLLVIDDEELDLANICQLLKKIPGRKYTVFTAQTIESAVEIINQNTIDLCLVDYILEDFTAKDFVAELETQEISVPIVILSGYSENGLDASFLRTQAFDFLSKDELNSQLLKRSIDYVLERRNLQSVFEEIGIE
ncbi:CheR family methyltransferase [Sessilibacter corallicola]|uniref:CheR family methyltransferase n=1 Tax=Sessilibacter corallicola TaxID=2904075 RepID=UPI001E4123AE|nr:chemotaxis protein CheB [Sessilibacter corallicola]MCE2029965.1 PAS domain-containing protein [Sessilibacter corallicola]